MGNSGLILHTVDGGEKMVAIEHERVNSLSKDTSLGQNYPNPFNAETVIEFNIPEFTHVLLKIYDILGNEVVTLADEDMEAGTHKVKFKANHLSNGIYLYNLTTANYSETKKITMIK